VISLGSELVGSRRCLHLRIDHGSDAPIEMWVDEDNLLVRKWVERSHIIETRASREEDLQRWRTRWPEGYEREREAMAGRPLRDFRTEATIVFDPKPNVPIPPTRFVRPPR